MPHIVEFRQAADLDETIAVGIGKPDDGDGQPGRGGSPARCIGGGDLMAGLFMIRLGGDGLGGAGDLATGMIRGAGQGQPGGQGRLHPAAGQGIPAVVDQPDGFDRPADGQLVTGIGQAGPGQGAQIQLGDSAQSAVTCLQDDVGIIAGAGRKTRQVDAGPVGCDSSSSQALAADGHHPTDPGLPGQDGILDGGSGWGAGVIRQYQCVCSGGRVARDTDAHRAGVHAGGGNGGNRSAAVHEDGILMGIVSITGAVKGIAAAVIVGLHQDWGKTQGLIQGLTQGLGLMV